MIRKSSVTLNFANTGKRKTLVKVLEESLRVTNLFVVELWFRKEIPKKYTYLRTETWLGAATIQVCSMRAASIVKEAKMKQAAETVRWKLAAAKAARKKRPEPKPYKVFSMPVCKALVLDLDQRSLKIVPGENSFDLWVHLTSLGNKTAPIRLNIPSRKHKHFNDFVNDGWKLKNSGKLSFKDGQLMLDVYFEKEAPELKTEGKALGIDIGYKKLLATSEGKFHGKGFSELAEKIQRKRQGSKGFKCALRERDQYVFKTVKELPWNSTKTLVIEGLKGLKDGRRFSKQFQAKFQRWTYPALIKGLKLTSERLGVQVVEVNPAFTSQTCPWCGNKDKNNRNGEAFACTSCDASADADTVGSVNVLSKFLLPEYLDPVKCVSEGSGACSNI